MVGTVGRWFFLSEDDLAIRIDHLDKTVVAMKAEFDCYVSTDDGVELGTQVRSPFNDEEKIIVFKRKDENDENGGVELFLLENDSERELLEVANFFDMAQIVKGILAVEEKSSEIVNALVEVQDDFDSDELSEPYGSCLDRVSFVKSATVDAPADFSEASSSSRSWEYSKSPY